MLTALLLEHRSQTILLLTHAYAVSIHRSQGSEYPCVVVLLTRRSG